MGFRKDDCQQQCSWEDRERQYFATTPPGAMFPTMTKAEFDALEPDPSHPAYRMCMDACEAVFPSPEHDNVWVTPWPLSDTGTGAPTAPSR